MDLKICALLFSHTHYTISTINTINTSNAIVGTVQEWTCAIQKVLEA